MDVNANEEWLQATIHDNRHAISQDDVRSWSSGISLSRVESNPTPHPDHSLFESLPVVP